MKNFIAYTIRYPVFSNLLMVALLLGGVFAATKLKRERLPSFSLERIYVSVPYPDALAKEVEEAICIKVEEAIEGVDGIKKVTSTAAENNGRVIIELEVGSDMQTVLNEVRNRVDSIDTFPEKAEKPIISEMLRRDQMINLALYGNANEQTLKELGRTIKDEVVNLPGISQVTWSGIREYEIAIEVSQAALREYQLSFQEVADSVRKSSLNLPGGTLRTKNQEIRLQTKARKYTGKEYADIVVRTETNGSSIYLSQVADIKDGFEEELRQGYFNQKPAVLISIYKTDDEDALLITKTIREYCENKKEELPTGLNLAIWSDGSKVIQARMDLLLNNGKLGFILVLLALGFFLSLKLSFWVAMGVPISFGGGLIVLWLCGSTLNLISMFALIMALGIVVDDAIVVGENIYSYRQKGKKPFEAAVQATTEVAGPVIAAVLTSIIAFAPMLIIGGTMGKIIKEIPMVMIAVLSASLIECLFILPAHLNYEEKKKKSKVDRFQEKLQKIIDFFIEKIYKPPYFWSLRNKNIILALSLGIGMFSLGLIKGGLVPFIFFPKLDSEKLESQVVFPPGTPAEVTLATVRKIESAAYKINEVYAKDGPPIVQQVYSVVGEGTGFDSEINTNVGYVMIELNPGEERSIHSDQISIIWRDFNGPVPGALSLTFGSGMNHGGGKPIEIALLGKDYDTLISAAEDLKKELNSLEGVYDVEDDYRPGKLQILPKIKPEARLLGINERMVGEQLFQGFSGEEALRLQRGPDEVKVKIRYPRNERDSFAQLKSIQIRLNDNSEIPFTEIADIEMKRGPAKITRQRGMRQIKVTADVDQTKVPGGKIAAQLKEDFLPQLLAKFPGITHSLEGQQQERRESMQDLTIGFTFSLFGIFAVLSIVFGSYIQPLIIMCVIPFGYIGAVIGHWALGYPLTMMSMFGIVALSGIVVNDSLVLIARINTNIKNGLDPLQAVEAGGVERFRAIILTSITTVAGLLPIMFEKSLQAQFVIPMALSLSSGLIFATFLTLFLVPCLFLYLNTARCIVYWLIHNTWPTSAQVEPAYRYRKEGVN